MSDLVALLAPVRERLAAATPGPWRWDEEFGDTGDTGLALTNNAGAEIVGAYNHHCCSFRDDPNVENENDAALIATAPTDLARLLAAVEAVVALHSPVVDDGEEVGCLACDWETATEYPCPTITALTTALSATTHQEGTP